MKTYILLAAAAILMPHLAGFGGSDDLTLAERDALTYMREEEKLARDVYQTLGVKWGARRFGNIAQAEQTHMDSVKSLLDRFKITDPAAETDKGEFKDPNLQKLYAKLVEQGTASRTEALKVGCLIEELDIKDLKDRSLKTKRDDIKMVFGNLERGSRNHLRAYFRSLSQQGGTYKPAHLSQADFDKIVNSPMERGRGG